MDRGAIAISTGADAGVGISGTLTTDTGALTNTPFSLKARYEWEPTPTGTNPEELLAAACASCFTEELAARLAAAGHQAQQVRTEARVHLVRPGDRWTIGAVRIHCTAVVPGISDEEFLAIVHEAKASGPIEQALRPDVTVTVSRQEYLPVAEPATNPGLRSAHRR
ncbi:MAG: OsmC family peroxiredoxin [Deltaproteobacteria bacterium]|nr:OsmC family peroxiredoxin [Kofleriaceae bacterium]